MINVDARGYSCPVPVVKTKKAIDENPGESISTIVDSDVAKENVARLAENQGYKVSVEQKDDEYHITLTPK